MENLQVYYAELGFFKRMNMKESLHDAIWGWDECSKKKPFKGILKCHYNENS